MAKCNHRRVKKEIINSSLDKDNNLILWFKFTCLDCREFWNKQEWVGKEKK